MWLYTHSYVNYLVDFTSDLIRCLTLSSGAADAASSQFWGTPTKVLGFQHTYPVVHGAAPGARTGVEMRGERVPLHSPEVAALAAFALAELGKGVQA